MNNNAKRSYEETKPLSELLRLNGDMRYMQFQNLEYGSNYKPMITNFQFMDIYIDIHPFKETAILLGSDSEAPEKRYINANRIKSVFDEDSEQNLMIAAQGPVDASIENFWRMVHQENVGRIVTLVEHIGGPRGDCCQYFPTGQNQPTLYGDM